MSTAEQLETLQIRVARIESTAFRAPLVTDSMEDLFHLIDEALQRLDPDHPHRNRITIEARTMDLDEFNGLPDVGDTDSILRQG